MNANMFCCLGKATYCRFHCVHFESPNYVTFMTGRVAYTSKRSGNHDKMEEESSTGGKSEIHIVQLALHQTLGSPRLIWLLSRTEISLHPSKPNHKKLRNQQIKRKMAKRTRKSLSEHTQHTPTIIPDDNIRLHSSPNVTARSDVLAAAMLQAAVL